MRIFGRSGTSPPVLPHGSVPESISTGFRSADVAMQGGYRFGTVTLVRSDRSVTGQDFRRLVRAPTVSALRQGMGALIMPAVDESPNEVFESLLNWVPAPTVLARVRVLDYVSDRSNEPWRVLLGRGVGRSRALRSMVDAERAVSGTPRRPFLEISAADTLEGSNDHEVAARMLAHGLTRARKVGNLGLVWIRDGSPTLSSVQNLVDSELVLQRDNAGVSVTGVRPVWESIALDASRI